MKGARRTKEDFDPRKGTHLALNNPLPEYELDQRVSW
jgi:hypothetical protein